MLQLGNMRVFRIILLVVFLSSLISLASVTQVSANPGTLIWTYVDTPSPLNNVIVSPSEINFISIGSDDLTFYAVDIPDQTTPPLLLPIGRLYKSGDGGLTWQKELSAQLIAAGAFMPVWNIAMATDDVNFVVAITDSGVPLTPGPKLVYISTNGGARWNVAVTGLSLAPTEFISCVDISLTYGGTNRDIAIGTRDGAGTGRVFVLQSPSFGNWNSQDATGSPSSTGWTGGDIVALKFSPTYPNDSSLVVVSSDGTGTLVHLGIHDTAANTTTWDNVVGYPVQILDAGSAGTSPLATQIITADLELPFDFSGQDIAFRRFYVSTDVTVPTVQFGVYRLDDTVPHRINPPTSNRISSIAYSGTYAEGVLLAGEVTADPTFGLVSIWRTSDSTAGTPTWLKSDSRKSPTGGGNSGYANAQVAWSSDGARAYCGTSSANPTLGGTAFVANTWPFAWLTNSPLDESAFSISPCSTAYEQNLNLFSKTIDSNIGNIWNQLSLIDTRMDLLSDVAALEPPQTGENLAAVDYNVLYLFSINNYTDITHPYNFDSLWRSTSDPLGRTWERVLCYASAGTDTILRIKQTSYDETDRSDVIVFGDRGTDKVGYSSNEGQLWNVRPFTGVTDLVLSTDQSIYILNNSTIYKYEMSGTGWILKNKVDTELNAGHTIAVPLKNRGNADQTIQDMVLVGEAGPPNGLGRIAYADFAETIVTIGPPDNERIAPPVAGDAHVIFDDQFDQNGIIYNATSDLTNPSGKIYRWVIGKSTAWDELEPPNAEFYGLVQRHDVLYGAWRQPGVPETAPFAAGVDRTIYPRRFVPPPPEWDYLIEGLPTPVVFNREPSSLKVSSNQENSLWAIDNAAYNFANNIGRLWEYTDILAKVGPWTTSPPSGSYIPVDPKSGRAVEINFAWRSLGNVNSYELQVAKDIDFNNRVLVRENITPVSQLAPEVYLPAGALIPVSGSNIGGWSNLESGHAYYWRVRARAAITGEIVRSPWSATMYFTVEAGLPTASPYPTVTLFSPTYGAKNVSVNPGFTWSGMPGVTKYEFILAHDSALQKVVVKANVPMTSFLYDGKLDNNTTYFWQVRAIEPVVSDPSPIGTFTVIAEKKPVTPEAETPAPIPSWIWWIIAVFTALVVSIIAFTMVKPSYVRPGGGKLFKVEPIADKPKSPIVDKPKNPIVDKLKNAILDKIKNPLVKIWESIIMAARRKRFFGKHGGSEPKDIKSKDSQEKLP